MPNQLLAAYSFLDVQCAITGPNIALSIADGGVAEEGITVEHEGDKDTQTMGADGSGMHSLSAAQNGRITVRLLKTSPLNFNLSAAYTADRASAATWAQNTISVSNLVTGDRFTCHGCAFVKFPNNVNSKVGGMIEWVFNSTNIAPMLGAGSPTAPGN